VTGDATVYAVVATADGAVPKADPEPQLEGIPMDDFDEEYYYQQINYYRD
jgi:hypothetical protein